MFPCHKNTPIYKIFKILVHQKRSEKSIKNFIFVYTNKIKLKKQNVKLERTINT